MEKKSILQKGKGKIRSREKLTYLYEKDQVYFAQVAESIKDLESVLWGVAFIDSSEGWAVGDQGTVLHIEKAL